MQTTHSNGRVQTSLVTSKIRVVPMKKQTITCLELLRATILARLVSTVIKSLKKKIGQVVYWVDSRTVLCWIRNEKQYVWNSTSETEWMRFVNWQANEIGDIAPGNINPTDLPSHGLTRNKMVDSSMWWNRLLFHCSSEENWLRDQPTSKADDIALAELIKNPPKERQVLTSSEEYPAKINLSNIINWDHFSKLKSMLHMTANVLRFVSKIFGCVQ